MLSPQIKDRPYDVSIVIPCYNESERIQKTLQHIEAYLKSQQYRAEVVLVDDGSKDDTVNLLKMMESLGIDRRIIELDCNQGKGAAVRKGILEARGKYVIFTDADEATPIHELEKLLPLLREGSEVVIGSRYLAQSLIQKKQSWIRRVISRSGNWLISKLLFGGVKDTQCGFKGFQRAVAQDLFSRGKINRWGFDFEMIFLAKKLSYSCREVPVEWHDMVGSQFRLRHAIATLKELFSIVWFNWRGVYEKKKNDVKK